MCVYMHYKEEQEEEENNENTLILVDCRLNIILRRQ